MKENVIDFLGNTPKSGSEAFNRALELYRKSKGNSPEQVRYMNTTGYSPERLEILKYELKKLHSITDLEVAKSRRKSPLAPKGGIKKENISENESFVIGILGFDPKKASEEDYAKAAVIIRHVLRIENNPVDENDEVVSDAEFVTAVRGYFESHQALGEAPEKTFEDLVQIVEESKKTPSGVKDPKVMAIPVADFDTVPSGADDQQATQDTSEETQADTSETAVNTQKEPSQATQDTSEATSVEHKMTSEEIDEQAKGAAAAREKFLKEDLSEFDVEASKYNEIKSFAADLSDYINEDPKDQKGDTLKVFILEAKKKFPAN